LFVGVGLGWVVVLGIGVLVGLLFGLVSVAAE